MNPWRPYPLIRLVAAFAAGIFSAVLHVMEIRLSWVWPAALLGAVVALAGFPGYLSGYRLRWIRGVLIMALFVLLGNQYTLDYLPQDFSGDEQSVPAREGIYLAEISGQPAVRKKTVRMTAEIFACDSFGRLTRGEGRSLLYMQLAPEVVMLRTGDLVVFSGKPSMLPGPVTPGAFDMRKYYGRQGIRSQVYVTQAKWRFLSGPSGFSVRRAAGEIRDRLLTILHENQVTGEEFAVAGALLLGYVSEIDKDLLQDYSSSGAMHILSVSGMHVGVIYLFLEFMIGLAGRRYRQRPWTTWIKTAVMIVSIWAYAVITGLSPPVQRAAIMLGMIILGKSLKRQPEILNILAASLFLILISDPFLVLDVGCQFSYLAVAGIVLLYKPVYDLYVTSRWFPDKVWSLVAVSIAAQLATFPLGLYVFHQFPNYFLLTNLLAVPLSSLIIYTGILLLALGSVPWLGPLTGKALSLMVWLLNQVVRMIDSLPGSVTRGIFLTLPDLFLLYALILFFFLYFLKKKKIWLFLFLSALILVSASRLVRRVSNNVRTEILVYHGKTTNIDFHLGDRHFLIMQDPFKPPDDYLKTALVNQWASNGVVHHFSGYLKPDMGDTAFQNAPDFLTRHGNYLHFCGKRIVLLNQELKGVPGIPLHADILVVCQGVRMKKEEMGKYIKSTQIIMPGSQGFTTVRVNPGALP